MSLSAADRRIRSLRPPKGHVDAHTPHGAVLEDERRPDGTTERALTAFLSGAECPFTCSFCDLWQWTIDGPTPPGALVAQLQALLGAQAAAVPDRIKLYNASNFFDPRAVPTADLPAIAALVAPFTGVTVESHASTIGARTLAFARQIAGRLEVAVGLETIDPVAAAELNKRLDLAQFDRAARYLTDNGMDLRVFALLGAPYVQPSVSIATTMRTVEYAVERGAAVVSIIPVRGGNGEMERLRALGHFAPPTLGELETILDACLQYSSAVVTVDLWDVERLSACEHCRTARVGRLARINVSRRAEPRVECTACPAA